MDVRYDLIKQVLKSFQISLLSYGKYEGFVGPLNKNDIGGTFIVAD